MTSAMRWIFISRCHFSYDRRNGRSSSALTHYLNSYGYDRISLLVLPEILVNYSIY